MGVEIVKDIPEEWVDFKVKHYQEIFGDRWQEVFSLGHLLAENEEFLVLKDKGEVAGGCVVQKDVYDVKFRGLAILPKHWGRGLAKNLMRGLEELAIEHHDELIFRGEKPTDIDMMFLRSVVYMNTDDSKEAKQPVFQFGSFLKKFGFSPFAYNKLELSEEEIEGIKIYSALYPELDDRLRVFKKAVVDYGVDLSSKAKAELTTMTKKEWDIVMGGLNWKLDNYGKSGKVSYRYDLCPICDDMGSTEQDSDNCKQCYIYVTCMEPFREVARFKENFEVSNAYFSEMKKFMLDNKPY